ncbi:MAG: hypothetical protein A2X31_05630 [Elusimicrobia bacterium GWB2_63_22]|nr:MAG: hypothetical protein A2X31_05630 [Elusimicrobia bacterium GWB2_63_22]
MAKKRRQPAPAGQEKVKAGLEVRPAAFNGAATGGNVFKSRILWLLALILIVCGFAALKKVDPWGQNGWAIAAPALLLCGYLLIIPAIVLSFRRSS